MDPYQPPQAHVADLAPEEIRFPARRQVILGLLVSPWAMLPLALAIVPVITLRDGAVPLSSTLAGALSLGMYGVLAAYVTMFTYGVLVHWLLARLRILGLVPLLVAALLPVVLVYTAGMLLVSKVEPLKLALSMGVAATFPLGVAFLYWYTIMGHVDLGRWWAARRSRRADSGEDK